MSSAHQHSLFQAQSGVMTHQDALSLAARIKAVQIEAFRWAENIASTQSLNIDQVVEEWLNSPGHRENIMGAYTHFGSGAVKSLVDGQLYWTQHFAAITAGESPCGASPTIKENQYIRIVENNHSYRERQLEQNRNKERFEQRFGEEHFTEPFEPRYLANDT